MKYLVTRRPSPLSYMNDLDRLFSDFLDTPVRGSNSPSVDVREAEDAYILEAELPGYEEKDVEVSVEEHVLRISSKQEEEREEKKAEYLLRERACRSFERRFALPEQANEQEITGEFKNGILTLKIPKSPELRPKKIDIKLAS